MYACGMSEVGAEGFNGVVVEVDAGENFPRIVLVWRVGEAGGESTATGEQVDDGQRL